MNNFRDFNDDIINEIFDFLDVVKEPSARKDSFLSEFIFLPDDTDDPFNETFFSKI